MMQRIDLAPLLRETVATPYSDMVTRSTGAALRDRIEQTIAGASHRTTQLDFTAVGLLDFSCADEVVAKLLLTPQTAYFLVLQGLREDHHEAIDHVLTHHRLAIAAVPPGCMAPRLLGWVEADARKAFAHISESGPLDASSLAQALDWSESRSREALGELTLRRLVRPVGDLYYPLQTA